MFCAPCIYLTDSAVAAYIGREELLVPSSQTTILTYDVVLVHWAIVVEHAVTSVRASAARYS